MNSKSFLNGLGKVGSAVSPFLSTGTSVLGSVLGSSSNSSNNRLQVRLAQQQMEFQERMFREQQRYNREMFDLENEWNSAINQRKRLQEAGYSPYSPFMGMNQVESASGGAVTPPTGSLANTQSYDFSPLDSMSSNLNEFGLRHNLAVAQSENLDSQSNLNNIEGEFKRTELIRKITNLGIDASIKRELLRGIMADSDVKENTVDSRINESVQRVEEMKANVIKFNSEKTLNEAHALLMDVSREFKSTELKYLPRKAIAEINELATRSALQVAQGELVQKEAALAVQQELESLARTYGIKLENGITQKYAWQLTEANIENIKQQGNKAKQESQSIKDNNIPQALRRLDSSGTLEYLYYFNKIDDTPDFGMSNWLNGLSNGKDKGKGKGSSNGYGRYKGPTFTSKIPI